MYSGEYVACDVTLSVYPHRASLKNMPGYGGNQTYDLWNASPMLCQLSYAVRSVLGLVPSISMQFSNHDFFLCGVLHSNLAMEKYFYLIFLGICSTILLCQIKEDKK